MYISFQSPDTNSGAPLVVDSKFSYPRGLAVCQYSQTLLVSEALVGNHLAELQRFTTEIVFISIVQMMTQDHANLLIANRVEIVEDLLVDDVLNFLQSKMVFDVHDTELIRAEVTSRRQAGKLLDLLETKNDAAFYHFRKALEEPYPHLVEYLQENAAAPRKVSKAKELSQRGV